MCSVPLALFALVAVPALACGSGSLGPAVTPQPAQTATPAPPDTQAPPPATPAPPTAIVLPTATTGPTPVARDLSGTYSVVGANFDGSAYRGRVAITRSEAGYNLEWTIGGATQLGSGTLTGDTFTVRWTTPDESSGGDAVYTLKPDGSLEGVWTIDGASGQGAETLTPL